MKIYCSKLILQILLIINCLLIPIFSANAQQKTPPPPGSAKPIKLPAIIEKKLPNGLTVILAPLPNVPKITSVLTLKVSQTADINNHPGLAQLAPYLINEGTTTRSSQQIKEQLRSIGGSLSISTNSDSTSMTASCLSEFSSKLFDLMSDIIQNPSFPEKEVELAKENSIQARQLQRSNPRFLARKEFQKDIFGQHPYSFVTADEKSIAAIKQEDLKTFASKYYIPNNSLLVVTGDINPDIAFAEVEKAFSSWKLGTQQIEDFFVIPKRDKRQIYFINRPNSVQSTIYLGNTTIAGKDNNYFSMTIANSIFCGSFYSRLTTNIRENKGYTYSPFSINTSLQQSGYFLTGASVRSEVTGPTLLEIFYELDRMRVLPVTEDELSSAKSYNNGNFSIDLASQAGLASEISNCYILGISPKDFIENFPNKINAVSIKDVQDVAVKYFDTYHCAVVIVGDYEKVKDQIKPFGDIILYDIDGNVIPAK